MENNKTLIFVATNLTDEVKTVPFFGKGVGEKESVEYSEYAELLENDELFVQSCRIECANTEQQLELQVENNVDKDTYVTSYYCGGNGKVSNVFNVFQDRMYMVLEPKTSCKIYLNVR